MASPHEYFEAAGDRLRFLRAQRVALTSARKRYKSDSSRLSSLLERTWREMVGYLLPDVTDEELEALQQRLHYPSLMAIKADFEQRLTRAEARRDELAGIEEVAHHDIVVAGYDDQQADIADTAKSFRHELAVWDELPWFVTLETRGWFRPDYRSGLTRWFGDWRAVSFLMHDLEARLDGVRFANADAVREHRRRLVDDAAPVLELEDELTRKRSLAVALKEEHQGLIDAPQRLLEQLYQALGKAIRDHLEASPVDLRYELAKGDKHLTAFLKKVTGVAKQVQYLEEMVVSRIDRPRESAAREIAKLEGKVAKRRHKHSRSRLRSIPNKEVEGLRRLKADKWEKRHTGIEKLRTRVAHFDRYEAGSFGEHFLWWNVMTKGARADDIHDVREHQHRFGDQRLEDHPHAQLDAQLWGPAEEDDVDAVAAAAAFLADDMASDSDDWSTDVS